jgi:hypothetical protein
MGNVNNINIVLGSLRYKSAPDTDLLLQVPLLGNQKLLTEYLRSIDINLNEVYQNERAKSDIFKPACKFTILFQNSLAGRTNYIPFENNLYYLNAEEATINECFSNSPSVSWTGLPQYNEFDFIRNDYNLSGYTQPIGIRPPHVQFVPKSANTYNWNFFLSYAFTNDFDKELQAVDYFTNITLSWKVSDGIPFIIQNENINGLNLVSFRCPIKHGLNVGEYVKIKFNLYPPYFGLTSIDTFEVYSLGSQTYGSNDYVFNIINVGFTGNTFNNGNTGTIKRIIDNTNPIDTISEYYVRKHKLLTNVDDAILVKAGFEENIFGTKKKFESGKFTPNGVSRVSIKEGSQSYSLSFNNDIKIGNLLDNQQRPLSELFFTVIWKGYFGWMFDTTNGGGLKQGWEFNLPLSNLGRPTSWWVKTNSYSNSNLPLQTYTTQNGAGLGPGGSSLVFCYVESLKSGDVLDGDVCEWNNFEQKERVISKIYHKLKFNQFAFTTEPQQFVNNPFGYYYQPHHQLVIREYSDYIEEVPSNQINDIPNYAYYSTSRQSFRWRDLYTYGFVDSSGIGVDYPFLNGSHYPFSNNIFRIIPEGSNYFETTIIEQPLIDNCE